MQQPPFLHVPSAPAFLHHCLSATPCKITLFFESSFMSGHFCQILAAVRSSKPDAFAFTVTFCPFITFRLLLIQKTNYQIIHLAPASVRSSLVSHSEVPCVFCSKFYHCWLNRRWQVVCLMVLYLVILGGSKGWVFGTLSFTFINIYKGKVCSIWHVYFPDVMIMPFLSMKATQSYKWGPCFLFYEGALQLWDLSTRHKNWLNFYLR